ncbi:hypothetical protein MTBLM1_10278 [Rhodospirillaceae bacterium LM-1]|nr:hypothetical protein MTBLM1_10278 [Rhodospirillaceae bacterium LM-1]
MTSFDLKPGKMSDQYEAAIKAMMRSRPDLSRTSAARLVNEILEIADENGK